MGVFSIGVREIPGSCSTIPSEVWGPDPDTLTEGQLHQRRDRLSANLKRAGFNVGATTLGEALRIRVDEISEATEQLNN